MHEKWQINDVQKKKTHKQPRLGLFADKGIGLLSGGLVCQMKKRRWWKSHYRVVALFNVNGIPQTLANTSNNHFNLTILVLKYRTGEANGCVA